MSIKRNAYLVGYYVGKQFVDLSIYTDRGYSYVLQWPQYTGKDQWKIAIEIQYCIPRSDCKLAKNCFVRTEQKPRFWEIKNKRKAMLFYLVKKLRLVALLSAIVHPITHNGGMWQKNIRTQLINMSITHSLSCFQAEYRATHKTAAI